MAISYKNIVITPNISNTADPKIQFSGANATVNTDITLNVYPDSNGTLSFEGSAGQLFSITNDLSNSLFSVNDVSGIPSIEVFANGLVSLIPISGNVVFGAANAGIIANTTGVYVSSNSTVNTTQTAALVQVANSTSSANLTSIDLKIGATTVVNATQVTATLHVGNVSGSYANISGQVNTATLYATTSANIASAVQANATGLWTTGTVNAATHAVGTAFTANATVVNAVSYYSGTLLVANTTVINATHLAGSTWAAPQILGGTTANGASLTYANVSGQVNTATLYATTSANIASAVQANATGVWTTGTVNGAVHSIGTTFIANTLGVYHTGTINAASHTVGTAFTANATVVNAVSYYSGTLLVANTTVINATHLAGYTLAAPSVIGSGTANGASLTYANVSGQVNTATMYATTSANIASIVQANSLGVHVGANVVANTIALKVGNTTLTTTNAVFGGTIAANGGIGTAKQVLTSGAAANASWATLDMTYIPDAAFKKSVRAATTADLAAASATTTTITGTLVVLPAQDGITLVVGNRLLVKNQTAGAQNGIYEVTVVGVAATTAWVLTRTADADTSSEIAGAFVSVDEGTVNGGKVYDNDFKTTDTLGTTAMAWNRNIDDGGATFLGNVVMGTGSTGIYPTSNTVGNALGNTTARWVLVANSGDFSTTLAAGNTTVTGFVNATSSVNAASHTVGAAFTANATVVNAVSYYSGTLLVANTTVINATHLAGFTLAAPSILGSGTANGASLTYANVSGQVNTATLYAATSANVASIVQANSLGVHVGANVVANTTTLKVGNTTITTTNAIFGGTMAANGGIGTAGQVLTSGAAGNVYWSTVSATINQAAQYSWTNTHSFSANVSFTGNVGISAPATNYAKLYVNTAQASDAGNYNQYNYYGDSNGTMTGARSKVGFASQISNFNQNKSGDGLTRYDAYYYGSLGDAYSGSSSSSQNAYAYEMTGGKFTMYHYANGAGSNTINNARGMYGQVWLGSQNFGTVNNAYGVMGQIYVPSTTPSGIVNAAVGVYAGILNNTGVTINNSYLFYGSRQGAASANSWGLYITGEANNYISGNTYFNSNVAIGQGAASDTRFRIYGDFGVDFSTYGMFGFYVNANTALTAAPTRYGHQTIIRNVSQNKNVDGVTTYSTNYRGVVGDVVNGNTSSGGDARANEMIGGNFRAYQYANGAAANTLTTAKGSQNQIFQYGSGVVTSAYGTVSEVNIGNNSVTGNITTAYGSYSEVQSNTAATIATGYLYYGIHTGATTTNKYGVYVTGEGNNYFSGNVSVAGALSVGANVVANTTMVYVGNSTVGATLYQSGLSAADDLGDTVYVGADQIYFSSPSGTGQYTSGGVTLTGSGVGANVAYLFSSYLQVGNTTAFANYSSANLSIYGGSALYANLSASSFTMSNFLVANSLGVFHSGTTGAINAASHTIGTTFIANTLGVYHTGTMNAASHSIGSTFIANTLGVYHTGTMNAASHTVGTAFTANSTGMFVGASVHANSTAFDVGNTIISTTNAIFGGTIAANGGIGTAGQVLTSGAAANAYWATPLIKGGGIGSIDYNTERARASGIYSVDALPTNGPPGAAYSNYIQMTERGDTSAQIVVDYSTGQLHSRGIQTATPTYSAWKTYISNAANINISGGFTVTAFNLGTGSGTVTPSGLNGNYQYITNNGAFTLAVPAADCAIDILITNGATAGAITFSGYTVGSIRGSTLTTTNAQRFLVSIRRVNAISTYSIYALQ